MKARKFRVTIDLDDAANVSVVTVAEAVRQVADSLEHGGNAGWIRQDGVTVGEYSTAQVGELELDSWLR